MAASVARAALTPSTPKVCTRCRLAPTSRQIPSMPLRMIITAAKTVSRASAAVAGPPASISVTIRPTSMTVMAMASTSVP